MSWNKYYIFVKSPEINDLPAVLNKLQLGHYKPGKKVPLHVSNKPTTLFAGIYNGSLLIVHQELVFEFFKEEASETEKRFIDTFPDKEIAVLVENGTSDLYSYAVIVNGVKVRMKDGADGQVFHNTGELLPEEKTILAGEIFDEDTLAAMREDGLGEEEIDALIDQEASWRVPNLLSARYLGEPVNRIDTDKVLLTMYE